MAADILKNFAGESREILAAILTQSRDCIKLFSLAGELEYINPNGLEALAVEQAHLIVGLHWTTLWPPENANEIERALACAANGEEYRFQGFRPTERGEPRWWDVSVSPVRSTTGRVTHILAISRDITDQVGPSGDERNRREEAEHTAQFERNVSREMRHRLKNLLAVVAAVAKLQARHATSVQDLIAKLEGRLQALARAQDLLTVTRAEPMRADMAIRQIVDASGAGDRIVFEEIVDTPLSEEAVQAVALILGELQTNALKHGALRDEDGTVEVSAVREDAALAIRWTESSRHQVAPFDEGHGGFQLIRRLGSAGGKSPEFVMGSHGLQITFYVRPAA